MADDISWMSARELRRRVAARDLSAVEVIESTLSRIEALDATLCSFITVAGERALDAAARADAAVSRGDDLGPLHGVPVALKDEAWTADMPSTGASLLFKRFVPSHDGAVAERLRRAGAIIVGKTNMPEFAAWPRSMSRVAREAVNPWDVARISGASSGGSAAAVASGMVPVAIGSDGGGSIRIPSALCGVVGLFPTPGRVPSYGSFSYSEGGSLGPIGRTTGDVALVQQVIAGPDPRDGTVIRESAPDVLAGLDAGVERVRIAWTPDFGWILADSRVVAVARAALERVVGAEVAVDEIDRRLEHPFGDGAMLAELQAFVAEREWDLEDFEDGDPAIPETSREQAWMWPVFAGSAPLTTTAEFRALCARHLELLSPVSQLMYAPTSSPLPPTGPSVEELKSAMAVLFASHDVVCSPTMATVAPPAPPGWRTPYDDPYMGTNFTFIANTTGCPAASVPAGLVDGLPVGLQVIASPGNEATVLRVCHAVAEASPTLPRPSLSDTPREE